MILDKFKLDGKKALVTGASRGIGKAIALGLAQAGADVAVVSRGTEIETTAGEIETLGRRSLALRADLAEKETAQNLVDSCCEKLGGIDILVNNAGLNLRAAAEEYPYDYWERVIEVDLNAVFRLCRNAGRVMLGSGWGRIVNIASLISFQGGITIPAYAAAKHGVAGLTKALANEWSSRGVCVNAIAPGYVSTELTRPIQEDKVRNPQILERIPQGHWADPEDLVGAAVFLSSDAASYVQGHVLVVDGGWMGR